MRVAPFGFVLACWLIQVLTVAPWCSGQERPDTDATRRLLTAADEQRLARAARLLAEVEQMRDSGRAREALPLAQEVLQTCRDLLGPQHPDVVLALNTLGATYLALGDYANAEPVLRQSLRLGQKVLPADHPMCVTTLKNLGVLHGSKGEFDKAEPLLLQALTIRRKTAQTQPAELATSLNDLAILYDLMGKYESCEPLLQEALEIRQKVHGPHDPLTAISLHTLAGHYESTGRYAEAVPLCRRALDIQRKRPNNPDTAVSLNTLANLYHLMGESDKAESLYRQALGIQETIDGPLHPNTLTVINNLAGLHKSLGDLGKAESLYLQVLEGRRKVLGEGHPDVASTFDDLGGLYFQRRDFAKAEPHFRQALDIRRAALPPRHPYVASSLNNLALLYQAMGQYAKAEPMHRQALEIYRSALGPQHPFCANVLVSLAFLHSSWGNCAKAEPLFDQALAIVEAACPQRAKHADILSGLAELDWAMGDHRRAADKAREAAEMELRTATDVISSVSEAQALNYVGQHVRPPNMLLVASRLAKRPAEDVYAQVWARRGLVFSLVTARARELGEAAAPETRSRYADYVRTRQLLAAAVLAAAPLDPARRAAHRNRLDELNEKKERLERALAAAAPGFRRRLEASRRSPRELADRLPPTATLVDFVQYFDCEQDPQKPGKAGQRLTRVYAAFLVSRGRLPVRVEIGPADAIDAAIAAWRADVNGGWTTYAPRLRRLLLEPIDAQLPANTRTLYLCADGALTAVPWAALPGSRAGAVLLDDYALAVLPSGQFLAAQLAEDRGAAEDEGSMLVVGGVDYGRRVPQAEPSQRIASADGRTPGIARQQAAWAPLPGTQAELAALAQMAGSRRLLTFQGAEASAERVLAGLARARWAHLATHGFFADHRFRSALQMDESGFEQVRGLYAERSTVAGRNPLVLSGLVLAGANLPREADLLGLPMGDGGILTAEAIASLDLSRLDLAVLSACETGLGDVAGGEGVFGLQRAFHVAGAKNVVASLWKVDDQATAALMKLFYANLWQKNMPPIEALRAAQLFIYRNGDRKTIAELAGCRPEEVGKFASRALELGSTEPLKTAPGESRSSVVAPAKSWAGFVLSGPGR